MLYFHLLKEFKKKKTNSNLEIFWIKKKGDKVGGGAGKEWQIVKDLLRQAIFDLILS